MMFTMLEVSEQEKTIRTWIAGVKSAGVRAIINLSGMGDSISQFQSDEDVFIVSSFVPHHWLFPKLAGVVHHGGAGTLHAGLAYGLPTLVLPFGADQPFNGDRVKIQKLGPAPIPVRSATTSNFAAAVHALVNEPAFTRNAKRVSDILLKEDGVGTAVFAFEEIIKGNALQAPIPVQLVEEEEESD
jgi:sterol 3beta-glucosyltransferase